MRSIKNLLISIFLSSLALMSYNVKAASSVWKISDGDNYFYLGGTIHLLMVEDHPLPQEFHTAYQDANKVVFETDLAATQTPAFQEKFINAMMYHDDKTLLSELTSENYQNLEAFMTSRQVPIASFSKFQPWGVSMMLSVLEYQRLDMLPGYGVDAHFQTRALADNKTIESLETPEEQLTFLQSMATIDPNQMIDSMLRDLNDLPEFVEVMKSDWRGGHIDKFSINPMVIRMQDEFPKVYQTLLADRNDTWMTILPNFVKDDDIELVLVGVLHLSGEQGLLHQLKELGFQVEQLND